MKLAYSVIASVLFKIKESDWWVQHLRKETENKWATIRNVLTADLTPDMHGLIDNAIGYKKQMLQATSNNEVKELDWRSIEREMSMTYRLVKQLPLLREFIGVQPMSGPVGLAYKMNHMVDEPEGVEVGVGSRAIRMEVTKQTVTAMTRRLSARYGIEVMQDMAASHPALDFEAELIQVISQEVFIEILNEIVSKMAADCRD
jgi:hypothetical protein